MFGCQQLHNRSSPAMRTGGPMYAISRHILQKAQSLRQNYAHHSCCIAPSPPALAFVLVLVLWRTFSRNPLSKKGALLT